MRRVGDDLMVFRGLPGPRENLAFHQDKAFWYLTGVSSPDANLVLDGKSGRQILFLPKRTERVLQTETWNGEVWDDGDPWVAELTGFEEIRSSEDLPEVIGELLDGRERIGVSLNPTIVLAGSYDAAGPFHRSQADDELDGRPSRQQALASALAERFEVETFDVGGELVAMRLKKTPEEVAAVRRASRAGALAMAEAMRSTAPGIGEWDLDALMRWVQIREGADGRAYSAIVGSGGNSCILHYTANSRRMQAGEVVLIDFGPQLDHYTTDITRTWPVDGTFTERQAELYDAVLEAQLAGIDAAKPGATLMAVHQAAARVLQQKGHGDLMRHFTCHWIGQEVHDPGNVMARLRARNDFHHRARPLRDGDRHRHPDRGRGGDHRGRLRGPEPPGSQGPRRGRGLVQSEGALDRLAAGE